MKITILFITLLALFNAGYAQTLDKAKSDQFFDESIIVSPEVLDKYAGVYSNPEAPVKLT